MNIDWGKVSELAFGAILQGLISAFVVYITFRLGIRESDRNWRRQLEQATQEKESERVLRCIEAIQNVISLYGVFESRVHNGVPFTEAETTSIKSALYKAFPIVEKSGNEQAKYYMRGLHSLVLNQSPAQVQEIQKRTDLLKRMAEGLRAELTNLEASLYSNAKEQPAA